MGRINKSDMLILFGVSLFISIFCCAFPFLFIPPLTKLLARPICPNGQFQVATSDYSYGATSGTSFNYYCVNSTGKHNVGFQVFALPTLIGAVLICIIVIIYGQISKFRSSSQVTGQAQAAPPAANFSSVSSFTATADSSNDVSRIKNSAHVKRLAELKEAHDSGLITEQEYEQKKKEILGDM